jgi:hypothetical protein
MTAPVLTIWVIYFSPLDYPGKYVLRGQDVVPGQAGPVNQSGWLVRDTLEEARAPLRQRGLYRMNRYPDDDPTIVETWI